MIYKPVFYFLRSWARLAVCLTFLLSLGVGPAWAQVSVLTQHNNNSRTGANLNETTLTTANVKSNFGKLFSMPVDGFVFAQPLYMPNLGGHNVLFVATAHDSVYAFDADSGAPLWQVSLGMSVSNLVINGTNILVEVGIISTPVIDPSTNTLYVVAKTNDGTISNPVQVFRLHALNILTGAEKLGGPVQIAATYPGSGDPNDGAGNVLFVASEENQRAALTLVNGVVYRVVYVAFASHEDRNPYHGWVLAYNAANLQQLAAYNDTPNSLRGGIWMSGQGLVADSNNNVYLITGNSQSSTDTAVGDYGESFLKLGLSGNALSVLDFFKANNYHALNVSDVDLGSGGPVAIPGTTYIIGGGKQGLLYLVNTNDMGQLQQTSDRVVQEFQADKGLIGSPVFWNNPASPTLYVWGGPLDSLKAFSFSNGQFNTTPASASSVQTPKGYIPCGALSVSSNQSVAGTGIVWATIPLADPDSATVAGKLYAFDATNVSNELWDSGQNTTRDDYGNFAKFCPPTVANGKVYVATDSGQVCAYGLNPPAPVWHHRDISALATAPSAAGDPSGYVIGGDEVVVYLGTDNHVHQLSAAANQGPWSHVDLTALTNAPLAAGNPFGVVLGAQIVVYRGTDSHIHQLFTSGNQWLQADLSQLASAPPASGDPIECSSPSGGQLVDYTGTDGHIHQLHVSGGHWVQADLTAITNATSSGSDPFEYPLGGNQIVPFRGVDSDIHQLYTINNNSQWVQADLSHLASAPPASGDPFGSSAPSGKPQVDYTGTDGHIHQLYTNGSGSWTQADLTAITNATSSGSDPFYYLLGGNQIVVFRGVDSDIHQVYTINSNSQWVQADLSKSAGAPPAVGNPFAYTFGSQVVAYLGTDGDIHLLSQQ